MHGKPSWIGHDYHMTEETEQADAFKKIQWRISGWTTCFESEIDS